MLNYEITGTPRKVVEEVQSIFDVTEAQAELIVMSLIGSQDEEEESEAAVRNFMESLDSEKAAAIVRGIPLTIRITGILPDVAKKFVTKMTWNEMTQSKTGGQLPENVQKLILIRSILEAGFDVMCQHSTWLGKELIHKDSFVALLDYTGQQVLRGLQNSIYDVLFTLEEIQEWMQKEMSECTVTKQQLAGDFELFEKKNLIRQRMKTVDASGAEKVFYQIVF